MDRLFIVASDTFRTNEYLGPRSEEPVTLYDCEVISIEEEPWMHLESTLLRVLMQRAEVVKLRVAGHLRCFLDHEHGTVEQRFPGLSNGLAQRLGEVAPQDIDVWGFKHVPESRIWATLGRIIDFLDGQPDSSTEQDLATELWNAFLEPSQVRLNEFCQAAHNFRRPGTVLLNLDNAVRALDRRDEQTSQERFELARRQLVDYRSDAREALAALTNFVNSCTNPDSRNTAADALLELQGLYDSIPAVEGSRHDPQHFRDWSSRTAIVLQRLRKDLLT